MPVLYEELPGSPDINMLRREGTATRKVLIYWYDIVDLFNEVFPDPDSGYLYGASLPGFPWMLAVSMKVTPFVESKARYDVDDWRLWHDYAQVEVSYSSNTEDQGQEEGGGDDSGPGGFAGSAPAGTSFLGHKIHCAGQYLTYPSEAVRWSKPVKAVVSSDDEMNSFFSTLDAAIDATTTTVKIVGVYTPNQARLYLRIDDEVMLVRSRVSNQNGTSTLNVLRAQLETTAATHSAASDVTLFNKGSSDVEKRGVGDNISAQVAIPIFDHTIEWSFVKTPPWLAIRACMGKVNIYRHAGMPVECGLFMGAEASRDVSSMGVKCWKLSMKFSEKNMSGDPLNPQGWNYFLRPTGDGAGTFQRLCRKMITNDDGTPLKTYLNAVMTDTQMFMSVFSTAAPFPQAGQFLVSIDDGTPGNLEIVAVTAVVDGNKWLIMRGARETAAVAHGAVGEATVVTLVSPGVYDLANFDDLFLFS